MKKLYQLKPIIFLLLQFAFLSSFAQKEIDFRIKLEVGDRFEVESTSLSQGKVSIGNNVQDNKVEIASTIQYHVEKKITDSYYLNYMYTEYYMSMKLGMKDIVTNPKTADMLNLFTPSTQVAMMMNKPFSAELSSKGKILSVKGNKDIEKEFKKKTKKLSPELREQVYTMVNAIAGNEELVNRIESWAMYIPPSAVKIGDTWGVELDSAIAHYAFTTETDSTYIVEGIGSSKKTTSMEIQGMTMITNTEEEFTITIEFDKHTFLPKVITKEAEMSIQGKVQGYPAFSQPPVQSTAITTLKIKKL